MNCLWKIFDYKKDARDILELFKDEPYVFFLNSSLKQKERGRYSFIGFDPFDVVHSYGPNALWTAQKRFSPFKERIKASYSPFPSGMLGLLSYDFGLYIENIKRRQEEDLKLPDGFFGFYDCVITIDHYKNKLYVSSTGLPEKNFSLRKKRAYERMQYILKRLSQPRSRKFLRKKNGVVLYKKNFLGRRISVSPWSFTKADYFKAVERALGYIRRGDIYQVNLAQRFSLDLNGAEPSIDPVQLYRSLINVSPCAFGGYFNGGNFQVISSSPERFLNIKDRIVQTRPMKGTRPRTGNYQHDRRYKQELLKSPKDIAELLMITDLERNDLGRVCEYGSVKVRKMRTLEEYETVFQATSTVEGVLKRDQDGFDLLRACFPGGSITGCPKIRAMEIIEELEPVHRGFYTGSLGYMSFCGDMDFNILIRTLLLSKNKIYFHVGGGIVADSTPRGEYQETLVKARAMFECLQQVFGHPLSKKLVF